MEKKKVKKIICVFENDIPFIYAVRSGNQKDVAAAQSIYEMLQIANAAPDGIDNFVMACDTEDNIFNSIAGTCGNWLILMADALTDIFVDSRFIGQDLKTGFETMVEKLLQKKKPSQLQEGAHQKTAVAGTTASILAQKRQNTKKYLVTEKQLDQIKGFLDDNPGERDLKFLVEDIEAQEMMEAEK